VIEQDGDTPPFEIKFDKNHSGFDEIDPNDISYEMVLEKLRNLDQNKACEVDKLHPFLLKKQILLLFRSL